jgi:hypothetical protein
MNGGIGLHSSLVAKFTLTSKLTGGNLGTHQSSPPSNSSATSVGPSDPTVDLSRSGGRSLPVLGRLQVDRRSRVWVPVPLLRCSLARGCQCRPMMPSLQHRFVRRIILVELCPCSAPAIRPGLCRTGRRQPQRRSASDAPPAPRGDPHGGHAVDPSRTACVAVGGLRSACGESADDDVDDHGGRARKACCLACKTARPC